VKFENNSSDKTWTLKAVTKGGPACDDEQVTIGPGETAERGTGGCCFKYIENRDTGERKDIGGTSFADCQDIRAVVVNNSGRLSIKDNNTPLADVWSDLQDAKDIVLDWGNSEGVISSNDDMNVKPDDVPINRFNEPDGSLRLDQAMFLGAHNAYAHPPVYSHYYQQELSIETQFDYGVRAFEFDTEEHNGRPHLCHRRCRGDDVIKKQMVNAMTGTDTPAVRPLAEALEVLNKKLDDNPDAIVILQFEDRANSDILDSEISKVSGFSDKVLYPQAEWPTIQWLRDNNKRVIMFSNSSYPNPAYRLYEDAKEIQTSQDMSMDDDTFYQEKMASAVEQDNNDRSFFFFKYFGAVTPKFQEATDIYTGKHTARVINNMTQKGVKDVPTVYFVDRAEAVASLDKNNKQSLMDYINKHNKLIAQGKSEKDVIGTFIQYGKANIEEEYGKSEQQDTFGKAKQQSAFGSFG